MIGGGKMTYSLFSIKDLEMLQQVAFFHKIYNFLFHLNFEYPQFKKWYSELFNHNFIINKERDIIICMIDNSIAGIAITKKTINERKICTLRVAPKYQQMGIGSSLLEHCFESLNDDKPLITIHISKYNSFKKLFEKYNFNLVQQIPGYYGFFRSELSYNGLLSDGINVNHSIIEQFAFNFEKKIFEYSFDNKRIIMPKLIVT